jgi:hypothetical protein
MLEHSSGGAKRRPVDNDLATLLQSKLPDGSMMLITVSVEADRTGRCYGEKIDPDEAIPEGAPGTDVQLDRAKAWLKSQPACKR